MYDGLHFYLISFFKTLKIVDFLHYIFFFDIYNEADILYLFMLRYKNMRIKLLTNDNIIFTKNKFVSIDNFINIEVLIIYTNIKKFKMRSFKLMNLKYVFILPGLNNLSISLFDRCNKLKKIYIDNTVKIINKSCFSNCSSLINIRLPNELFDIPIMCFENCIKLEYIKLPNNLVAIDSWAFSGCLKLNNLIIPKTVKHIYTRAFNWCESINKLIIPKYIENLHNECIYNTNFNKLFIPNKFNDKNRLLERIFGSNYKILLPNVIFYL